MDSTALTSSDFLASVKLMVRISVLKKHSLIEIELSFQFFVHVWALNNDVFSVVH
jgi:hypothetical protein